MRNRLAPLANRLDVVLFLAALLTLGPLLVWWSVLGNRHVSAIDALERRVAVLETEAAGEARTVALDDIAHHTQRQRLMMAGETVVAGSTLFVFVVGLFMLARNRRKANAAIRSMLQITAHELKTPIAGLKALLQSLQLGSIPEPMKVSLLARGLDECNRLEHLTETVLAYQRAVVQPTLKLEETLASTLVKRLLEHRKATFATENVAWTPGEEVLVKADPDAFRVVLENLLDNAKKYGGGKVSLEERVEGERYVLAVKDEGIGFEAKDAKGLFEPWVRRQEHQVTKHGSGLGLYLSRQLAVAMGGSLSAHSPGPGKGSTFSLTLKLAPRIDRHA